MPMDDQSVERGSEMDLALERALAAANLRAGDGVSTSLAHVGDQAEPSAVDTGDTGAASDGD